MNTSLIELANLRQIPKKNGVPQVLFCYWAGGELPSVRRLSLDYLVKYTGVPVFLVDKERFLSLNTDENPIHPAFDYLSAVHQSDYVRAYLWHYWGGAWHDIKATKVDFSPVWEEFADPNVFFVGRPEEKNGPAKVMDESGRWMPNYWGELVSVIAWVGRPFTPFSEAMLAAMHAYLDERVATLARYPGRNPREKQIQGQTAIGRTMKSFYNQLMGREIHYPIPWTLFGNIFHPLNLVFNPHISRKLPIDLVKNAGIYHRKK